MKSTSYATKMLRLKGENIIHGIEEYDDIPA